LRPPSEKPKNKTKQKKKKKKKRKEKKKFFRTGFWVVSQQLAQVLAKSFHPLPELDRSN
jgi:hypothetical protein